MMIVTMTEEEITETTTGGKITEVQDKIELTSHVNINKEEVRENPW